MLLPPVSGFALLGAFISITLAATTSGVSNKPSGTGLVDTTSSKSSLSRILFSSPSSSVVKSTAASPTSSSVKPSSSKGIVSSVPSSSSFSTAVRVTPSAQPSSSVESSLSKAPASSSQISSSSSVPKTTSLSSKSSLSTAPASSSQISSSSSAPRTTSLSSKSSSVQPSLSSISSTKSSSITPSSTTSSSITSSATTAPLTSKPSASSLATKTTSTSSGSLTTTVSGGATIVVAAGVVVVGGPGGGTIIVNGVASTVAAGVTEIAGQPNSENDPKTSQDLTTTTSPTSSQSKSSSSSTKSSTSSSVSPTSSCLLYQDPGYPAPDDGDTQGGLGDFNKRDPNLLGRSVAGRIALPDSHPKLEKRRGEFTVFSNPRGPTCTISATISQPLYPGPAAITRMEALPTGDSGRNEALFQGAKWWFVGRQDCGALPSFTSVGTNALPTAGSNNAAVAVGGNIAPLVNVDHVWELKFLNDFLGSQLSSSSFDCDDLNAVFMANDQARPTGATPQSRLQTVFDQLPGNEFPDFAGMLASTNNIKGTIFTPGGLGLLKPKNSLLKTADAALFTLQDIYIAFSMCNDPAVAQLFRNTNTRIFEAFQGIDDVITNGCLTRKANGAPISATFASAFSTFMDQRISTANSEAFAFATSLVGRNLATATGTVATAVARFTNSPLFTASNFAFNFDLKYTGTTPLKMRSLFERAEACDARSSSSSSSAATKTTASASVSTTSIPIATASSTTTTAPAASVAPGPGGGNNCQQVSETFTPDPSRQLSIRANPSQEGLGVDLEALYNSCTDSTGDYILQLTSSADQNMLVQWLGLSFQVAVDQTCILQGTSPGICTTSTTVGSVLQS